MPVINVTLTTRSKAVKVIGAYIQESIALHRRTVNKDLDMVILSEAARGRFLNEALYEGSLPSGLAPEDPEAVSSGVIGTVDGVPVNKGTARLARPVSRRSSRSLEGP